MHAIGPSFFLIKNKYEFDRYLRVHNRPLVSTRVKLSSLLFRAVEEHSVQHAADVPQVTEHLVFSLSGLYTGPWKFILNKFPLVQTKIHSAVGIQEIFHKVWNMNTEVHLFFNAKTCDYFCIIAFLLLTGLLRGDVMVYGP